MTEVKVYTTTWCPDCRMAKNWLDRHGIAYKEVNVETTPGAAEFVMSVNNGRRKVPTFALQPSDPRREIRQVVCGWRKPSACAT
jgi:glutaredoxin-like protein